jgi:hypothetical protein
VLCTSLKILASSSVTCLDPMMHPAATNSIHRKRWTPQNKSNQRNVEKNDRHLSHCGTSSVPYYPGLDTTNVFVATNNSPCDQALSPPGNRRPKQTCIPMGTSGWLNLASLHLICACTFPCKQTRLWHVRVHYFQQIHPITNGMCVHYSQQNKLLTRCGCTIPQRQTCSRHVQQ